MLHIDNQLKHLKILDPKRSPTSQTCFAEAPPEPTAEANLLKSSEGKYYNKYVSNQKEAQIRNLCQNPSKEQFLKILKLLFFASISQLTCAWGDCQNWLDECLFFLLFQGPKKVFRHYRNIVFPKALKRIISS